jgi:hydrogenase-4 component F
MTTSLLFAIPLLYLLAAVLSLIPLGRWFARGLTVVASAGALVVAGGCAAQAIAAGSIIAIPDWVGVDGFGALLLLLISFVGALASVFSWGYMKVRARERGDRAIRLYHVNFNLFLFSIVMVPMMQEIALAWIAIELTTLLSVLLVGFENNHEALEAAWKYVILTMIGAAIALLGIIVLYRALQEAHGAAFTWSALQTAAPGLSPVLFEAGFLLLLVGFGTKVGLVPLHVWLPDAHSQAPSPVCAILSGIETSVILYVILRLFPVAAALPAVHLQNWAIAFGLISVGVAAFLLIQVRDLKRLFAFSTVEHMGIILTAAGFGIASNSFVAPYQMLTHALAKPLCFFAAGSALMVAGTRDIAGLRGLIRRAPLAGAALLIGGLAITGAPPFALFLSEFSIIRAGLSGGHYVAVALLVAFIVVAFCAVLAHINRIVFGHPEPLPKAAVPFPVTSAVALVLAIVPVIILGVWIPGPIHSLLSLAGASMGGAAP